MRRLTDFRPGEAATFEPLVQRIEARPSIRPAASYSHLETVRGACALTGLISLFTCTGRDGRTGGLLGAVTSNRAHKTPAVIRLNDHHGSKHMRAAVIREHGGPEVLRIEDVPDPIPARGEVLVRLRCAALNYHDVLLRRSGLGMSLPLIMGVDGAGVREDTGERVVIQPSLNWGPNPAAPGPGWSILGDRVQGTYAELIALPEENLRPMPSGWSWSEAAALPTGGLTVYRGLFTRGALKAGETVVMLGAGGGIATFVIAMAAAAGARVLVTSSSHQKIERAVELGASGGVIYNDIDWTEQIQALTPTGEGADLVVDTVGRDTAASLRCVRPGGRLVVFGAPPGAVASFDLRAFYFSQRSIIATTLGTGTEFTELLASLDQQPWRPVIDSTFSFDDVAAAHARMESGKHFGKIVLAFD